MNQEGSLIPHTGGSDAAVGKADGKVGMVRESGGSGAANALLNRAAAGDEMAWQEVVLRNSDAVWATARINSANLADAEDVWQATWLLLAENLTRLRHGDALQAWLITTARRESWRLAKARRREAPASDSNVLAELADSGDTPEKAAMRSVANVRLGRAFTLLPPRCQKLLRVVAMAPETSYQQISSALGMKRGSIGPKKQRCLRMLRDRMAGSDRTASTRTASNRTASTRIEGVG